MKRKKMDIWYFLEVCEYEFLNVSSGYTVSVSITKYLRIPVVYINLPVYTATNDNSEKYKVFEHGTVSWIDNLVITVELDFSFYIKKVLHFRFSSDLFLFIV